MQLAPNVCRLKRVIQHGPLHVQPSSRHASTGTNLYKTINFTAVNCLQNRCSTPKVVMHHAWNSGMPAAGTRNAISRSSNAPSPGAVLGSKHAFCVEGRKSALSNFDRCERDRHRMLCRACPASISQSKRIKSADSSLFDGLVVGGHGLVGSGVSAYNV